MKTENKPKALKSLYAHLIYIGNEQKKLEPCQCQNYKFHGKPQVYGITH